MTKTLYRSPQLSLKTLKTLQKSNEADADSVQYHSTMHLNKLSGTEQKKHRKVKKKKKGAESNMSVYF